MKFPVKGVLQATLESQLSEDEREALLRGLNDIACGRVKTLAQIDKELAEKEK